MLGQHSGVEAGATGLNGLDLGLGEGQTVEARGELITVEEFALLGLDGAEGSAGVTADGTGNERGTAQRTVLLGLDAVGGERVGKGARGGSGMRAGSVIQRLCRTTRLGINQLHEDNSLGNPLGTERRPRKRMRGVRAAFPRAMVARILSDDCVVVEERKKKKNSQRFGTETNGGISGGRMLN